MNNRISFSCNKSVQITFGWWRSEGGGNRENHWKVCVKIFCWCDSFQRNHGLFGSVVSAIAGYTRPILPFLNRTQSLKGKPGEENQKVSPVNTWLIKENINGNLATGSCNHLNLESRNQMNHTPSPRPSLNIPPEPAKDQRQDSKSR